ncbi:hypothetical protein FKW77_000631 [Venturia effusa]|uniref:Fungal N-terminal domain-containing protein n=1 Tax=Venturia effusa TaxID=50376 RepID=A0A517L2N6_9PEZI|nr:hypothetical protein FKW77_000631 [Venturia effusa]
MDPLSITAAASSLAVFAFKLARGIYGCVDALKTADSRLLQLKSEVDALGTGLGSIASTFKSKDVMDLYGNAGFCMPESLKLLASVAPLLGDCGKILRDLDVRLGSVQGTIGKRAGRAFKLSLASEALDAVRHQIRT